jgi:hypothetical protein
VNSARDTLFGSSPTREGPSNSLFDEVDRDAEEEKRQLEEIGEANMFEPVDDPVESVSETYHASEAARSRGYRKFLDNFRKKEANDLLIDIKRFVTSVLMPHKVVYDNQEDVMAQPLAARTSQWFSYMESKFHTHRIWSNSNENELEMAREHLEKYVMLKLYRVTFTQCVKETTAQDKWFERRLAVLRAVLTADHLDVNSSCRSKMTLTLATTELEKVNSYRAPADKAQCIVRCCSFLFNQLSVSRNDSNGRPGADDFLPVFIYVVLHSNVRQLNANIEYISSYRNSRALMSKAGYCLVNLQSAMAFISSVSARSLTGMSQDELDIAIDAAETQLGIVVGPRPEDS